MPKGIPKTRQRPLTLAYLFAVSSLFSLQFPLESQPLLAETTGAEQEPGPSLWVPIQSYTLCSESRPVLPLLFSPSLLCPELSTHLSSALDWPSDLTGLCSWWSSSLVTATCASASASFRSGLIRVQPSWRLQTSPFASPRDHFCFFLPSPG